MQQGEVEVPFEVRFQMCHNDDVYLPQYGSQQTRGRFSSFFVFCCSSEINVYSLQRYVAMRCHIISR
jgi:hypothetical protein